jgi:hypothetical protein
MVDLFEGGRLDGRGFIRQEEVTLDDFLSNRFGRYFASRAGSRFVFGDTEEVDT